MKTPNARIVFSAIGMVVLLVLVWFGGDALSGAIEPATHYALYVVNADGGGQKLLRDEPEFDLWGPAWVVCQLLCKSSGGQR